MGKIIAGYLTKITRFVPADTSWLVVVFTFGLIIKSARFERQFAAV
jgi:hypothetical protein